METKRLKNIAILILILLNGFCKDLKTCAVSRRSNTGQSNPEKLGINAGKQQESGSGGGNHQASGGNQCDGIFDRGHFSGNK